MRMQTKRIIRAVKELGLNSIHLYTARDLGRVIENLTDDRPDMGEEDQLIIARRYFVLNDDKWWASDHGSAGKFLAINA
jgi:hypothetical protein